MVRIEVCGSQPLAQVAGGAGHAIAEAGRVMSEHLLDLGRQLRRDPFVGVEREHPLVSGEAGRVVLLRSVTRPVSLADPSSEAGCDTDGVVAAARVHHDYLVGPGDRRERRLDVSSFVQGDDCHRQLGHAASVPAFPRGSRPRVYSLAPIGGRAEQTPSLAMDSTTVLDLFRRCEGLLEGHFQLSSGLHSAGYLQCAQVLRYPEHASALGRTLAEQAERLQPDVVLSPALGGVIIGYEVARALGVPAMFAERRDGDLQLRRGFRIEPDARVLVVEDVVTTGGSTRETIEVATAAGGEVVGAASIIDRGEEPVSFAVPFDALVQIPLSAYEPSECPRCARGEPVLKPGSRPGH